MNVRVITAIGLLVVLAVGISSFMPEGVKPVAVGDPVKAIQLPTLDGKVQGIPKGEVVILNFWATWCPPCRQEVPSMVEVYEKLKDKGLAIVAVSVDRDKDDVVEFAKEQNMSFTVLHDQDSSVAREYGVFRYPETFIIDRNGVVRQHLNGAVEWTEPKFYDYILGLLAEPVTAIK
jgi:peroxiredoxin